MSELERDKLDDIIEIAAREKQKDADLLTRDEVKEVARELGIEDGYVDEAFDTLAEREEDREIRARKARRIRTTALIAGGVVAALVVMWAIWSQKTLTRAQAVVEEKEAQLESVIERKHNTIERWEGRPNSPDRDAELAGAENRVRVEMRRYNKAATGYNQTAKGLPHAPWRGILGFPDEYDQKSSGE